MEQLQQTAILLRQSCQPRFKLTDEQADLIRDGKLPEYKDGKVRSKLLCLRFNANDRSVLLGLLIGNVGRFEKGKNVG